MISCTDFIPAYSELFKYLEKRGGKQTVVGFWEYISDNCLGNLSEMVKKNGIRGCWMYWSHTLNEEAADFTMTLDEEEGEFAINMHKCPSKGRLLELERVESYRDYCEHCDLLYRRVLEPLGYEYDFDMSNIAKAACRLVIRRKN